MKTKITVTEFEHEDLVDLLSTALYGSTWFEADYNNNIYKSLKSKEGDCFEDKLADMLLAGHKITIIDHEAEGESYSKKFVRFDGESAIYEITLKDFLNTASTKRGFKLVEDVLSGDGDYWTADAFLQRVVFGEEIYG
jgi:hypothetical protein